MESTGTPLDLDRTVRLTTVELLPTRFATRKRTAVDVEALSSRAVARRCAWLIVQ
jgi:hypothetical protein